MSVIKAKCSNCGERGQMLAANITHALLCPNCQQTVRWIPETTRRRRVKFLLAAIPLLFFMLWAANRILESDLFHR